MSTEILGSEMIGNVFTVKIKRKSTVKRWQVPFDTVDTLIQAGTIVHDAVSILPVQAVSTVIVSILRTLQVHVLTPFAKS